MLLQNSICFQYYTKYNLGIAIFGSYHAGLRDVWQGSVELSWNNGNTLKPTVLSKGSYWHIGLEIGYQLSGKKKKTKGVKGS